MKNTSQFFLQIILLSMAVLFVSLAIVGAIQTYSPVPFWDEWNGAVNFFKKISDGDFTVW